MSFPAVLLTDTGLFTYLYSTLYLFIIFLTLDTLMSLLRISIFCRIGSTQLILPIRPKNSILNRVKRVLSTTKTCQFWSDLKCSTPLQQVFTCFTLKLFIVTSVLNSRLEFEIPFELVFSSFSCRLFILRIYLFPFRIPREILSLKFKQRTNQTKVRVQFHFRRKQRKRIH